MHVASVQGSGWLKQKDVNFVFGDWAMFDAARNNQKLAFLNPYVPVTKLHSEAALNNHEQFVFDIVMMPDERAAELDQFNLLTIKFPGDSGFEVVGEKRELFVKVDLFHADRLTRVDLA